MKSIKNKYCEKKSLTTLPSFNGPEVEVFWKHHRKGEMAGNHHFFLFAQRFLSKTKIQISSFEPHFNCFLQMLPI